jgi:cytochrome c oxidase cbb3-type subunit 1
MPAVAGGAQILLLVPVIAVGINHFRTVQGAHHLIQFSPTLRFTFFGAVGYTAASIIMAVLSSASLGSFSQFSFASDGAQILSIYMFFSMTMFGAIYFIVPRVTGCEWVSGSRIRFHFWFSAYGSIALSILLLVGGVFYGASIKEWDRDFQGALTFGRGFRVGTTIGWVFLLLANISFLHHLALMVMNRGRKAGLATLIHDPASHGHAEAPLDHAELVVTTEGAEAV